MALITWNSKYSVGVQVLDDQHKALLKVLNEFHAASMTGKAKEVAGPSMRQIVALAREHFSTEQRMMESAGYPGLAEHRATHEKLAIKLTEFVSRHEKGDTTMYSQLLYFMRDWLSKHMQTEDQQYVPWLASHGVH
ncbi:MAG: bacteriohemerythrin [Terracidiphilus sp.]|jgi:hemerythrin